MPITNNAAIVPNVRGDMIQFLPNAAERPAYAFRVPAWPGWLIRKRVDFPTMEHKSTHLVPAEDPLQRD